VLRIGIDTRDLNIARTGARTYLEEILAAFPRVAPEHEFVHLQPARYRSLDAGIFRKICGHVSYTWWKQVALPVQAHHFNCDLVFCTDYTVPLFPWGAKVVPVFHDATFWANPTHYNRLWRILLRILTLPAARKAPAVVTVSEFSCAEIARYTSIPSAKIYVVANAPKSLACEKLSSARIHQVLKDHGIDPGTPFALYIGVLEKRKNLTRLVKAFSQFLTKAQTPYHLVLVGQPGPKQNLDDSSLIRETIEHLGLGDKVLLVGYVADKDLSAFYQGAEFLVFPSLYEGFGIPILEAFTNGLPVAAANATAIPEVVGNAALLFDPLNVGAISQAMLRLERDADFRRKLVHRGYQRVARYSWDKTARKLVDLFEHICDGL